jgi:hypothetical protein
MVEPIGGLRTGVMLMRFLDELRDTGATLRTGRCPRFGRVEVVADDGPMSPLPATPCACDERDARE